jgi:hypothetical protein
VSRSFLAVALFGLTAPGANAQHFGFGSPYPNYPQPQVQYVYLPYPPQQSPYMYGPAPVQLPAPICTAPPQDPPPISNDYALD